MRKIEHASKYEKGQYILSDEVRTTEGILKVHQSTEKKGIWPFRYAEYKAKLVTVDEEAYKKSRPGPGEEVPVKKTIIFENKPFRSERSVVSAAIKKLNINRE
jgi:hypothetical protein